MVTDPDGVNPVNAKQIFLNDKTNENAKDKIF